MLSKLQKLAEIRDPSLRANRILMERIEMVKGEKGEPGYTPIKGKDYFTQEEVNSIISYIRLHVKDGKQGLRGEKGDSIKGDSPIRGIHYWTEEDRAKIRKDIEALMPKIEQVKPAEIKEIIRKKIDPKEVDGLPDVKELSAVIKFLKAGGFRGGGDTVAAGTGISITKANGVATINNTGTATAFIDNEIVAGSGTSFTLSAPQVIGSEHLFGARNRLYPTTDYTITAGGAITTVLSWSAGDLLCDFRKA